MTKIVQYNNSCKIVDEDDLELFHALDRELSFQIQGAEFSAAYKGYINEVGEFTSWDGKRHLLSPKGRFPAGLLPRVQDFFLSRNIPIEIIDERTLELSRKSINISGTLEKMGKIPRKYQILAANKAVENTRGVLRLPTGSGKSLLAALITAELGKKALILVIGKDLLYQMQNLFQNVFGQEIGIVGDGKCDIKDINIATVWSVGQALGLTKNNSLDDVKDDEKKTNPGKFRRIKEMLLGARTIILDECHLAACDTVQIIARNIKAENIYGMSASPWRDDGADLLIEAFLGKRIFDISARELINQGYLVEPSIRFLAPTPYKYKSGKYPRIYSKYIVENEQRNAMIIKGATRMVEQGFSPLVLFHTIKHGDVLFNELKKNIPVALLSGKDSSKVRKKIKESLEDNKIKCIIASKIYDLGIDIPMLSGLVIAGAGKSSVRALQRIGRVIRPYKEKNTAAVLDFFDQAPHLIDHAQRRCEIYETEFHVTLPRKKQE